MAIAGALLLLAGCQDDADSGGSSAAPSSQAGPAEVVLSVPDGSVDVSPVVPLEISVTDGELGEVALTDEAGVPVPGSVADSPADPDVDVWTPEVELAYGATYTLTASAAGSGAQTVEASSTFTTVTPAEVSTPSIGPLDGQTVGVGMPIRVYFDQPVADRAAVERHLLVETSNPTDGIWSWLSDTEVHFRPSTYWPAHTDVTLDADLYGVSFGDGVWGEKDRTVSFRVGDEHVSIADAGTHTMQVFENGRLVQTYPISAGSDDNPSHNGVHVVTGLDRNRVMDSSTYGVPVDSPGGYRTPVEYAVRISNNGEFVHAAPWSVAEQGNANVSHGCINMSTERAAWFFDFSQPGDIVEIRNSIGPPLGPADGDIYDWTLSWDEWRAGSALQ
ncbi:L,D-transpeptidase [Trujillonella humicola]|uniref:L,D-transpeptidase n=1 Tax=Trujillonella humicola TaxID=3383699 RepID=UPI0039060ED6